MIGFGTSGLRGRAEFFERSIVATYVAAFLDVACGKAAERTLVIGMDLRASSPEIAQSVIDCAHARGWNTIFAADVPTPALAAYALARGYPSIMVTGSHIPSDYNGIKFYRPDGELLKEDEAPIREAAQRLSAEMADLPLVAPPAVSADIAEAYVRRYLDAFAPDALAGLRIGVFEHSAVGRDLVSRILEGLGAIAVPFGRSDVFVAVDTEAVAPDQLETMRAFLREHGLDAIVSTDGDGDRALILDEAGNRINGDALGALAARALSAEMVVTPLTATSAIDSSGWFRNVVRTRIGSPYVVAAMSEAAGVSAVVGFEANGGFLLQSDLALSHGTLARLPTRDAMLPLVALLADARASGATISRLAAMLPARSTRADRIEHVAPDVGMGMVRDLALNSVLREALDPRLANPLRIDTTDGTRFALDDGTIVHFRQSGNAPELRCYIEAASDGDAEAWLGTLLGSMRLALARA